MFDRGGWGLHGEDVRCGFEGWLPLGSIGERVAGRGGIEFLGDLEDGRHVANHAVDFEALPPAHSEGDALVGGGFESFGEAAPGVEPASCGWRWTEVQPEIAGRFERGRSDAFWSGVVECVGHVVDRGAELAALFVGVAQGARQPLQRLLFALDVFLRAGLRVLRMGEAGFGSFETDG